jgi:hypothetical protein
MESLKRYCSLRAGSILESVIALCIISICLYIAVLIFAAVFTPRTSTQFYNNQNKVNELFYLYQLRNDSLMRENENPNLSVTEEPVNGKVKKISVHFKDSTKYQFKKSFYVSETQN